MTVQITEFKHPFRVVTTQGKINFTRNWNGKLNAAFFTSIRNTNNMYILGCNYEVWCNNNFITRAKCIEKIVLPVTDIPNYTLMLDMGLAPAEARAYLAKMYQGHTQLEIIMFENLEIE
jgi:hypothetical protein